MRGHRTVLIVAGLVTAVVAVPPTSPVASAQDACPQPYSPLLSVDQYGDSNATLPAIPGEQVFVDLYPPGYQSPPVDTDGDGIEDTLGSFTAEGRPTTVTRGDGVVAFQVAGRLISLSGVPDLDGNDRDELLVVLEGTEDAVERSWLVPGTVVVGTHDPADVGIELPIGRGAALDDRDGDGFSELLLNGLVGPISRTAILSGADVIAVGAPGDATDVEPLLAASGQPLGWADLGAADPVLVTGEYLFPDFENKKGERGVLHLVDESGEDAFTTFPFPWAASTSTVVADPQVFVSDQGTYMTLAQGGRNASRAWLWRVDDPCGEVPFAVPPDPPPPADPVDAEAEFTG